MPIFLMLPQVQLRKRLELARDAQAAQDAIPDAMDGCRLGGKSERMRGRE